ALGTSLSEVAAIVLVGGNIYGYNQTLASATLYEVNAADYSMALAIAIVLLGMILILMGSFALLQHQSGGRRVRFPTAAGPAGRAGGPAAAPRRCCAAAT